jgi:hypothetical protein
LIPIRQSNTPAPEVRQDTDPVERLDVGVQVAHAHADLGEVVGQLLGHPLGQRRHEHALARRRRLADHSEEIVDLPLHRPNLDQRVEETRRADHLLHDLASGALELLGGRRRADGDRLVQRVRNSSYVSGRLSSADGRRKP